MPMVTWYDLLMMSIRYIYLLVCYRVVIIDNSLHNDENYYHFLCFNHFFDSPANIVYYIIILFFRRGGFLSILVLSTR